MVKKIRSNYSPQFLLLLFGSLFSSTGSALVWPFLSIFLREKLDVSLTAVSLLLTIGSITGVMASFGAGMIADRYGRKLILTVGLFASAGYYLLMTQANSYLAFAALIAASGAFSALYPIGANAMVADLIEERQRTDAYATLRMMHNVGVAVGPVIGGYLNGISYTLAFLVAACAYTFFGVLTLVAINESLPDKSILPQSPTASSGFGVILRDRIFMFSVLSFIFTMMTAACMFLLLPVYSKENFGMAESQYSYLVTINALMCIFLQFSTTQMTKKYNPLSVLAVGALFYAVGAGSIALGSGFWFFAVSMVILTTGELVMAPTATALVAKMAPADMRGRYMSVLSLAWPVGAGIGPILGSLLNDLVAPVSIWFGAFGFGLISALGYALIARHLRIKAPQSSIYSR